METFKMDVGPYTPWSDAQAFQGRMEPISRPCATIQKSVRILGIGTFPGRKTSIREGLAQHVDVQTEGVLRLYRLSSNTSGQNKETRLLGFSRRQEACDRKRTFLPGEAGCIYQPGLQNFSDRRSDLANQARRHALPRVRIFFEACASIFLQPFFPMLLEGFCSNT
jgi:hypothetical protein